MEKNSFLLVRADAGSTIGSGHLMRCIALVQAWQDAGGRAGLVMTSCSRSVAGRLEAEGMELFPVDPSTGAEQDAGTTVELARRQQARWIVADGYGFDERYQRLIKEAGLNLLLIDDYGHAGHYYADIVLNVNISAREELYASREPYTRVLLGTDYALLRRDFLKWKDWHRKIAEQGSRILVTLGGADPENLTLEVIRALEGLEVEGLEAVVVAGGANRHYSQLMEAVRSVKAHVRLESDVTDMAALYRWADVAVSGGGGTCWEMAFLGLPNIILVLAENQRLIAEGLHEAGVSLNLGFFKDCSSDTITSALSELLASRGKRKEMSCKGKLLVDGLGAGRVVRELGKKSSGEGQ